MKLETRGVDFQKVYYSSRDVSQTSECFSTHVERTAWTNHLRQTQHPDPLREHPTGAQYNLSCSV